MMLIADKLQNEWNLVRHRQDHPSRAGLMFYFSEWSKTLGITKDEKQYWFNEFDLLKAQQTQMVEE